jgi:hypothetical protein
MAPLEASLHHAALVVLTALAAVLIAQVDLYPSYVVSFVDQGALNGAGDPCRQRFVMLDVVVGVYLNLHSVPVIVFGLTAARYRAIVLLENPAAGDELVDDHDYSDHEQGVE